MVAFDDDDVLFALLVLDGWSGLKIGFGAKCVKCSLNERLGFGKKGTETGKDTGSEPIDIHNNTRETQTHNQQETLFTQNVGTLSNGNGQMGRTDGDGQKILKQPQRTFQPHRARTDSNARHWQRYSAFYRRPDTQKPRTRTDDM